ncbi:hypothetical protein J6590_026736 [Homalodisca vitripennis]|nr:hypothetical protein J6590_026736 [Homalodisca vitripennis]
MVSSLQAEVVATHPTSAVVMATPKQGLPIVGRPPRPHVSHTETRVWCSNSLIDKLITCIALIVTFTGAYPSGLGAARGLVLRCIH